MRSIEEIWPKDKNSIVQSVLNDIQEHKLKVENVYVSQGKLDEVFRNITLPTEGTPT